MSISWNDWAWETILFQQINIIDLSTIRSAISIFHFRSIHTRGITAMTKNHIACYCIRWLIFDIPNESIAGGDCHWEYIIHRGFLAVHSTINFTCGLNAIQNPFRHHPFQAKIQPCESTLKTKWTLNWERINWIVYFGCHKIYLIDQMHVITIGYELLSVLIEPKCTLGQRHVNYD